MASNKVPTPTSQPLYFLKQKADNLIWAAAGTVVAIQIFKFHQKYFLFFNAVKVFINATSVYWIHYTISPKP